jgi:nascent polypeptide-associated complex subunit alpha
MMNFNPKQINEMMKKMGMSQQEIQAKRVIIEQEDKNIIIEAPTVSKISMQGQENWQIIGNARTVDKISEEDIKTIMEKTNASKQEAAKALKEANGDLAEAILSLS